MRFFSPSFDLRIGSDNIAPNVHFTAGNGNLVLGNNTNFFSPGAQAFNAIGNVTGNNFGKVS
jgi:hypothetical protein